MSLLRRLCEDRSGSGAAEFAIVLPLLMILLFVGVDGGRYLYNINRIEKATQFGARFAVVTNPVASDLAGIDYVGKTFGGVTLTQGDRIPASALASFTCSGSTSTCTGGHTFNSTAFNKILQRMQYMVPELQASNLNVSYAGSGLGFAGDPSGMQIAPLVTVQVTGLGWQPVSGFALLNAAYPSISTTLTAEDSQGTQSY